MRRMIWWTCAARGGRRIWVVERRCRGGCKWWERVVRGVDCEGGAEVKREFGDACAQVEVIRLGTCKHGQVVPSAVIFILLGRHVCRGDGAQAGNGLE